MQPLSLVRSTISGFCLALTVLPLTPSPLVAQIKQTDHGRQKPTN